MEPSDAATPTGAVVHPGTGVLIDKIRRFVTDMLEDDHFEQLERLFDTLVRVYPDELSDAFARSGRTVLPPDGDV